MSARITSAAAATATADRAILDLADRGLLGGGDLVVRRLQAASNRAADVRLGALGGALGLGPRGGDDLLRLALDLLLLALEPGEQPLGLVAQRPRLLEVGLDPHGPRVELAQDHPRHAVVDQDPDEDQEADRDHDVGVVEKVHCLSPPAAARRPR